MLCKALHNKLQDVLLVQHHKIRTDRNPYLDTDYYEAKFHERAINNVNAIYRPVWMRQKGKCWYCGRPILADQEKSLVQMDLSRSWSIRNIAYIHKMCEPNELQILGTMEELDGLRDFDITRLLEDVDERQSLAKKQRKWAKTKWLHEKLQRYFAVSVAATMVLTFSDVEEIDGQKLPPSAYTSRAYWQHERRWRTIAYAWEMEGYRLDKLSLSKQKLHFSRVTEGMSHLKIPDVLLTQKIPDNARIELETSMAYVIKKYGL